MRACRGFALPIALVGVVAISLAAAQMVRAVDTTTAVAGNLVLRGQTMATAAYAVEQALGALDDPDAIPDREHDFAARGYYASRLAGEDPRGIPRALQGIQVDASVAFRQPDANGTAAAYVIERLCLAPGPALAPNCILAPTTGSSFPGTGGGVPVPGAATTSAVGVPLYRVTARTDGPRGAVVVVQVQAIGGGTPRTLSWRVVAE